ncbi:cytochrome P450 [Aaosphaeria arxii CBS 175.79]|uniref:Cytochrome P450 n=1 Tax=Aaosphaeria arxii CBS 175.79 TaxID=1450172 RepID=A0A6A5Y537_9PLEO|nr:cytochrome P450 [Aaosphaeria arxii CBS 175.79]KAF2020389.1 cytochrome P450 [Aaosphaeria arxii CBS 175.79]
MACPFAKPNRLFEDLATTRQQSTLPFSKELGGYVVSRYDDIVSVLDQPNIFSSRPTVPEFPPPVKGIFANKVPEKGTLLAHDNPDHDRLRKSVASFFVPRRLRRFEPLLRATAHDLIDQFSSKGEVEIKEAFALPLPLRTIVHVAGLDPERWQWIGQSLALFGGITRVDATVSIEEKVRDVLDLHEYIAQVIEERRNDRRDDLISHIWNERDAGNVEMTDFEHLSMIPGLLLAGHETTTNVLSMGIAHLLHLGLFDEVTKDEISRAAAIEELLRYESAITGMPRKVLEATSISGTTLVPGDQLFVAYNSGSRDDTKFPDPNRIDTKRGRKVQHLGFGRGVHACLGAPLARLLLNVELAVLKERLPNLKLKTPYHEIQYHRVHEGRGVAGVTLEWDSTRATKASSDGSSRSVTRPRVPAQPQDMDLIVEEANLVADDVLQFKLRSQDGNHLPEWAPGAHIDVKAGPFGYRQYSICSDPDDRKCLSFAVLKETSGLGGSKYLHSKVRPGSMLSIRAPRNNFSYEPSRKKTIFIAGGIGITPILPMATDARRSGMSYAIVYLGRSRRNMAFLGRLEKEHGNHLTVWAKDDNDGHRYDLNVLFADEHIDDLRVYCCGPEPLLTGLQDILSDAPPGALRIEHFSNPTASLNATNTAFEVVLARSNRTFQIPESRSLLEVINEAGAGILSTCNKGLCGTCEVSVIDGVPDHRDMVLTAEEKMDGKLIMPCVSRCRGTKLTLDLW